MPQVIEWKTAGENEIVWRYPIEDITWGAQLIVHEFETAVFLRDGKAYDVFGAGRHTITTANLPLLTRLLSAAVGFSEQPFKSTVIYISLKQFTGLFGLQAQTTEYAPLQARGRYWYRVEDPNMFVNQIVGGQSAYTTDQVTDFLRGFLNERIIDDLSHYDLQTVYTRLDETSFKVKNALLDNMKRVGIELIDLKFEGIDTSPEWRDRLFFIKAGTTSAEVLRMETVKKSAEELGKSQGGGAALGAGMVIMQQGMAQPAQAGVTMVICPNCKQQVPSNSKFCPSCGSNLQAQAEKKFCPNCGTQVAIGGKFCSNCGNKIE
ncbi:MAG: SPFH domain-containing protein [Thaumarchaeota archaeon]|nr:SPFH domain-containing protein [Nitrososphaerota archaeon]